MTSGWSLFIIILTLVNIMACLWLLRWTAKPKPAEKLGGGADTGHVWDGDLREYNNPLPKWWLWVFYLSVAFGLLYLGSSGLGNLPASRAGRRWDVRGGKAPSSRRPLLAPFAA
jgi:cytochrome c oxidase cbb3-type subunit 3